MFVLAVTLAVLALIGLAVRAALDPGDSEIDTRREGGAPPPARAAPPRV